jgi:hypothetical protein
LTKERRLTDASALESLPLLAETWCVGSRRLANGAKPSRPVLKDRRTACRRHSACAAVGPEWFLSDLRSHSMHQASYACTPPSTLPSVWSGLRSCRHALDLREEERDNGAAPTPRALVHVGGAGGTHAEQLKRVECGVGNASEVTLTRSSFSQPYSVSGKGQAPTSARMHRKTAESTPEINRKAIDLQKTAVSELQANICHVEKASASA